MTRCSIKVTEVSISIPHEKNKPYPPRSNVEMLTR
eukprot:gene15298-17104_t